MLSPYYEHTRIEEAARLGRHRKVVGGLWEELGRLQFEHLVANGLKPASRLLDVGCGSLRGGIKFVPYLDAGNYFGTDINEPLLDAGYREEITPLGLANKLPRSNLVADGSFDFSWCNAPFDFAIAQSLFTHLPIDQLRVCLEKLSAVMTVGGVFFVTYFEAPEGHLISEPYAQDPGGVKTFVDRNPYHYRKADVLECGRDLPWSATDVGNWGHPRAQKMVHFIKRK